MFNSGPTTAQFDALSRVVAAQSDMLKAVSNKANALENYINVVADNATGPRADTHLLKALVAGLIAEMAARADDPYKELADILRRVRYVSQEFTIDNQEFNKKIQEASELVCEYAETYLRRGDRR